MVFWGVFFEVRIKTKQAQNKDFPMGLSLYVRIQKAKKMTHFQSLTLLIILTYHYITPSLIPKPDHFPITSPIFNLAQT